MPLLNASLTDCVFEVERPTTVEEVNGLLQAAADGPLAGILGYEERPLVSVDYKDDPRSAIVDALSTMVIDGTQVKILAWYDNEWGYANRLVELARKVARRCPTAVGRGTSDVAQRRSTPTGRATCATTCWSPAPTGPTRSPTARSAMLVLFYFYELGYSPFAVASLFLFYEVFGIVTNLVGGWLAARLGLKATLVDGPRHADRRARRCSRSCRRRGWSCPT